MMWTVIACVVAGAGASLGTYLILDDVPPCASWRVALSCVAISVLWPVVMAETVWGRMRHLIVTRF